MKISLKESSRRRLILIIILITVLIILLIFGTKLFLYFKLLIGNDLVITINTDKENLFLKHGENDNINFKAYAVTNLFCDTSCNSKFIDLTDGDIIDENNFNLKFPYSKDYILYSPSIGSGQILYRFDIECASIKSFLCHTKGEPVKRSVLITLNYDLTDDEKRIKQESKEEIINLTINSNEIYFNLDLLKEEIKDFNFTTDLANDLEYIFNLENQTLELNKGCYLLKDIWENEKYNDLVPQIVKVNKDYLKSYSDFISLNESVYSDIQFYNYLIESLKNIRNNLENFSKFNVSNVALIQIDRSIFEFNNIVDVLNKQENLANISILVNQSLDNLNLIGDLIQTDNQSGTNLSYISNQSLNEFDKNKIELLNLSFSFDFNLNDPKDRCCLYGKCEACCDDSCYNNPSKYPIIFIHGHNFNQDVSAEASFNTFENIQEELDKDGYLNAGSILLSNFSLESKGVWGRLWSPLTAKISYYFDILTNQKGTVLIQTKTNNLDTYALRLKDIINEVKYKTNRDRVIVVAHSMGGLIFRRYIQVFGENDIYKVILIDTPNQGISGTTLKYCSVFGTKLECDDLNENSLFISKLGNAPIPSIQFYNIIGVGCDTDGETGDGIVKNSSQYLYWAKNYYINGTCDKYSFKFLHDDILDFTKYPEVYRIINESIRENNISS